MKLRQVPQVLEGLSFLRLFCTFALLIVAIAANAQLATSGWAKFRGNAANSGMGIGQGANGNVQWFSAAPGTIVSSPAIGPDGTIYCGNALNLLAFDGTTGTQKWAFATGGVVDSSPAVGADGTVYVGSYDMNIYAINGATGLAKWAFNTGGIIFGGPAIGPDGTIYVGTYDGDLSKGHLYAINPATGVPFWSIAKGAIIACPAFAANGAIYIGTCDNNLYALNPANGNTLWTFKTGGHVECSPAVGPDGSVYINGDDGFIYAINGATGAQIWNFNTKDVIAFAPSIVSSPAIGSNGMLYVGSDDFNLRAFNAVTGALVWMNPIAASIQASPAIGPDGTVYLGPDDGNVYAINGATGALIWGSKMKGSSSSSPALGPDGSIYIADSVNVLKIQSVSGIALTLNPIAVAGGNSAVGTVYLNNPAAPDGVVVALASNTQGVTVPASVFVAGGKTSANFMVNTVPVNNGITATIAANLFGMTATAKLLVAPVQLVALNLASSAITGGTGTYGTVTLNVPAAPGGALVALQSASPVGVPQSILVPAGQMSATFPITSQVVKSPAKRPVYASLNGVTKFLTLTVLPADLYSVSVNPSSVGVGGTSTGTVTLTGAAYTGGITINLASSATYVKVPKSVTVSGGGSIATFNIYVSSKAKLGSVNIVGTLGSTMKTATLNIMGPKLTSISLNPTTVRGGKTSTGTVTLSSIAPTGGVTVTLSSNSNSAKVPSKVFVPAGKSSQTFIVSTIGVSAQKMATITASYGGTSFTKTVTINPVNILSIGMTPRSVKGGTSSTGVVVLDGPAPAGGVTIMVTTSDTVDSSVPMSFTIGQGKSLGTFKVTTHKVSASTTTILTATLFGVSKQASLKITR